MKNRFSLKTVCLIAFVVFAAGAVLFSTLASAQTPTLPKAIRDSGVLRVGSQQTYPPIEFRDPKSNEMVGVSTELLTEVAKRLGLKLQWVQSDYGALITGAKADRFDLASGGISDQPEREKELDFVNYLLTGTGILTQLGDVKNYKTIEDFSGKKVAFTLGAKKIEAAVKEASDKLVAAGKPAIEMVTLPSSSDAKMQLDLKRVDGYLNETCTLAYFMSQNPGKYGMVQDGKYILTPLITSWGFTKQNTELRDAVQATMKAMKKDGAYMKILQKWDLAGGALPEITINLPWDARK
jgi:polar amino acid transport system substrate-binding protein